MNRPPAFQFYPKDFLSDINVITMNMEERGYYITLLSMCWIEGCLKGGSQMVEAFVNQKASSDKICKCFYEKDGDFYHKRLEEERQKQIEWREKSSQGGKISGEKRRSKGGSRVVEPKGNQRATLQSSSLQSSSSLKYKKEKHIYGEYRHVRLTDEEYGKLKVKLNGKLDYWIKRVDEYCEQKGKSYKNYYLTILNWSEKEAATEDTQEEINRRFIERKEREAKDAL